LSKRKYQIIANMRQIFLFLSIVFLIECMALFSPGNCGDIPRESGPSRLQEFLETTHVSLSGSVYNIANHIDTFFADERIDEESQTSHLHIRLGAKLADGGHSEFKQRVKMNLELPRAERRLQIVLDSLFEDDDADEIVTFDDDADATVLGLRYVFSKASRNRFQTRVGLRFRPEPDPNIKIRWSSLFPLGKWAFRPTQFLEWESRDGFGETTRLDLDRKLSEKALFRVRGELTWAETSSGLEFGNSLSYSRTLSKLSGFKIALGSEGRIRPSPEISKGYLKFVYRRAIYKNWLFLQVEPSLDLPEEDNYALCPGIMFYMEGIFTAFKAWK